MCVWSQWWWGGGFSANITLHYISPMTGMVVGGTEGRQLAADWVLHLCLCFSEACALCTDSVPFVEAMFHFHFQHLICVSSSSTKAMQFRHDITVVVDLALKINYLSMYPGCCFL